MNEAYLRLVGSSHANWAGRGHFFGACAQAFDAMDKSLALVGSPVAQTQ